MDEEQWDRRRPEAPKLRRSNKSDNTKMEMDRETLSWLQVNTQPQSVCVRSATAVGELIMKGH